MPRDIHATDWGAQSCTSRVSQCPAQQPKTVPAKRHCVHQRPSPNSKDNAHSKKVGVYSLRPIKNCSKLSKRIIRTAAFVKCKRHNNKKHGSDLYLSPEKLIPHSPTHSSDQLFADTNKPMGRQPYKLAGLDGYNPAQPWKEPTAQAQLSAIGNQPAPQFPELAELDQDYDGWPQKTPTRLSLRKLWRHRSHSQIAIWF
jgi:hypothetical protein